MAVSRTHTSQPSPDSVGQVASMRAPSPGAEPPPPIAFLPVGQRNHVALDLLRADDEPAGCIGDRVAEL